MASLQDPTHMDLCPAAADMGPHMEHHYSFFALSIHTSTESVILSQKGSLYSSCIQIFSISSGKLLAQQPHVFITKVESRFGIGHEASLVWMFLCLPFYSKWLTLLMVALWSLIFAISIPINMVDVFWNKCLQGVRYQQLVRRPNGV